MSANGNGNGRDLGSRLKRVGRFLVRTGKDFGEDDGPHWAAVSYYTLLSLFPLLLAAASIAAYFVDPDWVTSEATDLLGEFLPTGEQEIEEIVQSAFEARQAAGIFGIASLLWSGTRVFGVIARAMNVAYGAQDRMSIVRRTAVEAVMLVTIGALFVIALGSRLALGPLAGAIGLLPGDPGPLLAALPWVAQAVLLLLAYFLLYRFVPSHHPGWRAALVGAAVAAVAVVVARPLFTFYVRRFGDYDVIYGAIAILVILIFWVWIVAAITIFGGEIVAHTEMEWGDWAKPE